MKKFLIIYEIDGRPFVCQHEAEGIFTALHKFENVQKKNVDCILSIDCNSLQGKTQLTEKEEKK
jgi:hypothetical protein